MYGHRQSGEGQNTFVVSESGLCPLIPLATATDKNTARKTSGKWAGFCPNYLVVLKIFRIFVG
jgi:hypothetical protein